MTIRVLLVDDHPLYRDGIRTALAGGVTEVVAEAENGQEAFDLLKELRPAPDVILLDLWLPDCSGLEIARSIRDRCPAPRVLMLSVTSEDDSVVAALRAGALGYLVKGSSREELIRAIQVVAAGGAVFSPAVAQRLEHYFSRIHEIPGQVAFPELTERERQVLDLIARGYGNRRIARELVLAEKTVRNHITHLFTKLRVSDRMEAAVRARDAGLGG